MRRSIRAQSPAVGKARVWMWGRRCSRLFMQDSAIREADAGAHQVHRPKAPGDVSGGGH
mgnify:CR=1 FL=1